MFRLLRRIRRLALLALVLIVALKFVPAFLEHRERRVFEGVPRILDGDTLHVDGQRIRLHGIDAPEEDQLCTQALGATWPCGVEATHALARRINSSSIRCRQFDTDRWDRAISVCYLGRDDLNAWMVSEGWAVAYRQYSDDYLREEQEANAAGRGIWSGTFEMPWDHRRAQGE